MCSETTCDMNQRGFELIFLSRKAFYDTIGDVLLKPFPDTWIDDDDSGFRNCASQRSII